MGYIGDDGYGRFKVGGKPVRAHRLAHELEVGYIPKELQLDHLCRVRACVNPRHLECVTSAENTRRGNAGLYMKLRTHCPQGHERNEANTVVFSDQKPRCRICRANRDYVRAPRSGNP